MVRKKTPQKWMADTWLITRTRTKQEQLFGFQFGKVLPGQTQEHFPSCVTSPLLKYQTSSTAAQWPGWPTTTDGAIITALIWSLHWHLPTTAAPQALCHIPGTHWTPPHTDGCLSPAWSLKPQSQLGRAVQMVWCTPKNQTFSLLFASLILSPTSDFFNL